jgi:hypothetical protein
MKLFATTKSRKILGRFSVGRVRCVARKPTAVRRGRASGYADRRENGLSVVRERDEAFLEERYTF